MDMYYGLFYEISSSLNYESKYLLFRSDFIPLIEFYNGKFYLIYNT